MSAPNTFARTNGERQERIDREAAVRLKVEQASYAYATSAQSAPTFTLNATSFEAREREIVAILGPNASGKSTLLRLIAGTIAPLSGRVELDGEETSRLDPRTRAQKIAVVHQESPIIIRHRREILCCKGAIRTAERCALQAPRTSRSRATRSRKWAASTCRGA